MSLRSHKTTGYFNHEATFFSIPLSLSKNEFFPDLRKLEARLFLICFIVAQNRHTLNIRGFLSLVTFGRIVVKQNY
jgi:hypothetical protein